MLLSLIRVTYWNVLYSFREKKTSWQLYNCNDFMFIIITRVMTRLSFLVLSRCHFYGYNVVVHVVAYRVVFLSLNSLGVALAASNSS